MRFLLPLAAAAALSLPAFAISVTIDPGKYSGIFRVTGFTEFSSGAPVTLDLADGDYYLDMGGSSIPFSVRGAQTAEPVKSEHAGAAIQGAKMGFNLAKLRFRAGGFGGACRFSHEATDRPQCPDDAEFNVVSDVEYTVDLGGKSSGTSFAFHIDGDGLLANALPFARGSCGRNGCVLTLNTVEIIVDPRGYAGQYAPAPYSARPASGVQKFRLVPGLKYRFLAGTSASGSEFTASLDAAGNLSLFDVLTADPVKRVAPAFAMSPRVMGFANVKVRVDAPAGSPAAFRVGGYDNVKDKDELVLLPSLVTALDAGEKIGYFLPAFDSVSPPALHGFRLTVVADGQKGDGAVAENR